MLEEYDRKRNFALTPEPASDSAKSDTGELKFVIQKHSARRLHYDLRLECDGVLLSWAVPKGPSYDPLDKRLAVQTEDHPLDYGSFEGIIPAGQYGAGPVIIWDSGTYSPEVEEQSYWSNRDRAQNLIRAGLRNGKISFILKGQKLRGAWTLFRLKQSDKDWILLKHKDEFANAHMQVLSEDRSIASGRTIDELRTGQLPAEPIINARNLQALAERTIPDSYTPMLATLAKEPFNDNQWVYEPKFDGIRAIAIISKGAVSLLSRRGLDLTRSYPAIVSELSDLKEDVIFDGEIVAIDQQSGSPSFQLLQRRSGLSFAPDIASAERKIPVFYYVFDIMQLGDKALEQLPLYQRKQVLRQTLVQTRHIRLVDVINADGYTAFQACVQNGLEGLVAKRWNSCYEPARRSRCWRKIKAVKSADFVICGYTTGEGARSQRFGSLLLGYFDEAGILTFAGGCGTGFNEGTLTDLANRMKPLETQSNPFSIKIARKGVTWLQPALVAEVKFSEFTSDGSLRAPVFLRLRPDKDATECNLEDLKSVPNELLQRTAHVSFPETSSLPIPDSSPASDVIAKLQQSDAEKLSIVIAGHQLNFSNLNKVFWPATDTQRALTKRDYAIYLCRVATHLLRHTKSRPITLVRFPHGIADSKFYQKHWPKNLPDFVESVSIYGEHARGDQRYLLCNNLPTLLWIAQIADLEIHTWQSRTDTSIDAEHLSKSFSGSLQTLKASVLNYPDFLLFDLDPYLYSGHERSGEEPALNLRAFKKTCLLAKWLKELLDALNLSAFVKTTGRTGLHIFVPIVRNFDFDEVRMISDTIGKAILARHHDDVTMDWAIVKRTGKVFLDHNMNARGKTLASIYSPRVSAQAAVSMPVRWDQLDDIFPTDFTMLSVPDLLDRDGDLWSSILDYKNDLRLLIKQGIT